MREIKFRAWETKEKRMLHTGSFEIYLYDRGTGKSDYGISHHFQDEPNRVYKFTSCKANNFNPKNPEVILMQFTGLLDKNKKEIYEGDIVEMKGYHFSKFEVKVHLVRFTDTGFFELWYFDDDPEIEIIGNIYENPELMKE